MAGVRQTVNELTRTNHGTIYAPPVFYVQGGPTIRLVDELTEFSATFAVLACNVREGEDSG